MESPPRRPWRAEDWAALLLALLLTLPALRALWQPGLQQMDDGLHHLFRLYSLDLALRAGHWDVRWLADEGFGYGFPVLNFYAPLAYYAGLVFRWLGAGYVTALELTLAAGLLLAAAAMYLFGRSLLGPWSGALAAVAYTWAPYHLTNTWVRGALAEQLAFVWIPLLLWAMLRAACAEGRPQRTAALGGSLAVAGLVVTHNLSVLLAAPVATAWGAFLLATAAKAQRPDLLRAFLLMALLGVLLSAFYWLPAIVELPQVLTGQAPDDTALWRSMMARPAFLVSHTWAQRYTILDQPDVMHPLGMAQGLLALAGLAVGLARRKRLSRRAQLAMPLWAALLAFALFMQSEWSQPVWRVPGLMMLQFPWRWQLVAAVATALLTAYAGLLAESPPSAAGRSARGAVLAALMTSAVAGLLMSAALPRLPWQGDTVYPNTDIPVTDATVDRRTLALYDYHRGLWLREHGSPWMFEYMPVGALPLRDRFFLSAGPAAAEEAPLAVQATAGRQRPLERRFAVRSAEPWTAQLHQFFFPGWQATVDGQPTPVRAEGPLALAAADVPAGQHEVVFRFGATPVRCAGWLLTALGAAAWVVGMVRLRRRRWLALVGVALLAYIGLAALQRHQAPTDYTPTPTTVTFGQEAQLVGFHFDPAELRPGGSNEVILNWLALRHPTTDYKVFLHLVDLNGTLWAQHDGEPGFFFTPTSRWQAGEFSEDFHYLEWRQENPPPGRYLLFIGLYDPATGQRLPVFDAAGQPIGDQVLLAELAK
ncbi:MAG: YfhO family protein [Caldilineales bacterium]|nr:YfhO family protein [Caldilineales bacterium]